MASTNRHKTSRGIILLPLLLVVVGLVLLLWNFLLIETLDPVQLLPMILVVVGVQILLQGDLTLNRDARAFGITRGSVEEATLEVHAADIDISIHAFPDSPSERLIAGQYAPMARPKLTVDGVHARLLFHRRQTSWSAMTDWEMILARDLPWQVYASSSTGQMKVNLETVITDAVHLSSGIGDIHLTCPYEAFQPIVVESSLGNIHIIVPEGHRVAVQVDGQTMVDVHYDETRYTMDDASLIYHTNDAADDAPLVTLHVESIYGSIFLA